MRTSLDNGIDSVLLDGGLWKRGTKSAFYSGAVNVVERITELVTDAEEAVNDSPGEAADVLERSIRITGEMLRNRYIPISYETGCQIISALEDAMETFWNDLEY